MDRNDIKKWRNNAWAWAKRPVAGVPSWGWAVAIATVVLVCWFWTGIWCWLQEGSGEETNGETLRNFMLILAGPVGLVLALRRIYVADKQAKTAQRGLQNERYQKGADMLGRKTIATRIGGIYALGHLAREYPEKYHIQIMDLLCAFVRHPEIRDSSTDIQTQAQEETTGLTPDIQAVLTVIKRRSQEQCDLEKEEESQLDLSDANLKGAHLMGIDLADAKLWGVNLEDTLLMGAFLMGAELWHSNLEGAILAGAILMGADLSDACLTNADLEGAELEDAQLAGAQMKNVKGVTQTMLNSAAHFDYKGEPLPGPNLEGAFCAETGKPLVWRTPPKSSSASDSDETNSS